MPPITVASLGITPYSVGAGNVGAGHAYGANHISYTAANARVTATVKPAVAAGGKPGPLSNMQSLGGNFNAAGNAIFLRFEPGKIYSVRLPVPPPPGVDFFFTDNLSGCKFYVDTIAGSNDLMVYHANSLQHRAPAGSPANFQSPLAVGVLDALHTAAQADYAGLPHPNTLALVNVATLDVPTYFGRGALAEQRKALQGRTKKAMGGAVGAPEFMGGCTVVGFFQGAAWHFYYQTWGDVEYDRPTGAATVAKSLATFHWNYIHKRIWNKPHHSPTMKVVDHAQFY